MIPINSSGTLKVNLVCNEAGTLDVYRIGGIGAFGMAYFAKMRPKKELIVI